MLFRKKIHRACEYCTYGTKVDNELVLCIKRGVVNADGKCKKFSYDPCKRMPAKPKALNFEKYSADDFSL